MPSSTKSPKFLADENVKAKLVKYLSSSGCDIVFAAKGLRNSKLIECAKKEKRVLLTNDKDFMLEFLYPPAKYEGIVVLVVRPPSLDKQFWAIEQLLKRFSKEDFSGRLFILSESLVDVVGVSSSEKILFKTRYG